VRADPYRVREHLYTELVTLALYGQWDRSSVILRVQVPAGISPQNRAVVSVQSRSLEALSYFLVVVREETVPAGEVRMMAREPRQTWLIATDKATYSREDMSPASCGLTGIKSNG